MKSPPNFEGLVLGCIDSYDSNQILILQGFSRSTRFAFFCTAQISKFQQKTVQIFAGMKMKFHFSFALFNFLGVSEWVFPGFSHTKIPKVQKNANLVDLEKSSKMNIWSRNRCCSELEGPKWQFPGSSSLGAGPSAMEGA